MTWFDWLLVGWWSFTAFVMVAAVGKPRGPIEPLTAAITVVITLALIAGLLITRGAL